MIGVEWLNSDVVSGASVSDQVSACAAGAIVLRIINKTSALDLALSVCIFHFSEFCVLISVLFWLNTA